MDTSLLKNHGLKIVGNAPVIFFISSILSLFLGILFNVSFQLVAGALLLGVLFTFSNIMNWFSGNWIYGFLSVFVCGVMPLLYLKSISSAATVLCIEYVVLSAYLIFNKNKLVSVLSK